MTTSLELLKRKVWFLKKHLNNYNVTNYDHENYLIDTNDNYRQTIINTFLREMNGSLSTDIHINVFSSMFMFSNVVMLYFKKDFTYFLSFLLLLCSSLVYHSTHNEIIKIVDKIFVYNVVIQGGLRVLWFRKKSKFWTSVAIITFLSVIFLYFAGYYTNTMCYDIDEQKANCYHGLLHLMGSVGHNGISMLL